MLAVTLQWRVRTFGHAFHRHAYVGLVLFDDRRGAVWVGHFLAVHFTHAIEFGQQLVITTCPAVCVHSLRLLIQLATTLAHRLIYRLQPFVFGLSFFYGEPGGVIVDVVLLFPRALGEHLVERAELHQVVECVVLLRVLPAELRPLFGDVVYRRRAQFFVVINQIAWARV